MLGDKQLIVQIRLFQTKMLCDSLQNTSMAHRLKTTALNQVGCYEFNAKQAKNKNPLQITPAQTLWFFGSDSGLGRVDKFRA